MVAAKDKTYAFQDKDDLPTVTESEAEMAKDAPAAVRVLYNVGAEDLAEALSLTNYMRRVSNG